MGSGELSVELVGYHSTSHSSSSVVIFAFVT